MTQEEYNKIEKEIRSFCFKHGLPCEISSGFCEVDFVMDYHEEAIDTKTLENPICICTERHIVVQLPKLGECLTAEERTRYDNIVSNLTRIASPDYIIGAKDGIVAAVMYCVWG